MLSIIRPPGRDSGDGTSHRRHRSYDRAQHQTAAQRPTTEGSPEVDAAESYDLHHTVKAALVFLGGLRRSFAARTHVFFAGFGEFRQCENTSLPLYRPKR